MIATVLSRSRGYRALRLVSGWLPQQLACGCQVLADVFALARLRALGLTATSGGMKQSF